MDLIKHSSNTKEASKIGKKSKNTKGNRGVKVKKDKEGNVINEAYKKPYVRKTVKETKGRGKSPRYASRIKKKSTK